VLAGDAREPGVIAFKALYGVHPEALSTLGREVGI
jgi:hypothetical protein